MHAALSLDEASHDEIRQRLMAPLRSAVFPASFARARSVRDSRQDLDALLGAANPRLVIENGVDVFRLGESRGRGGSEAETNETNLTGRRNIAATSDA
jgi:hypothetical protein